MTSLDKMDAPIFFTLAPLDNGQLHLPVISSVSFDKWLLYREHDSSEVLFISKTNKCAPYINNPFFPGLKIYPLWA